MQFFINFIVLIIKIIIIIIFFLILLDRTIVSSDYKFIVMEFDKLLIFIVFLSLYFIENLLPEKYKLIYFLIVSFSFIFIYFILYIYNIPLNVIIVYILKIFLKYKITNIYNEERQCVFCKNYPWILSPLNVFLQKIFTKEFWNTIYISSVIRFVNNTVSFIWNRIF